MTENNEGAKGFNVADRRRFEADGSAKEDAPERDEAQREDPVSGEPKLPEVDFSTFVLSLST